MIPLPDPDGLCRELDSLLAVRGRIHSRLRELTGERTTITAVGSAREFLLSKPRARPDVPNVPDDRDKSQSVRTWQGGLPTLGKGRR